MRRLTCLAVLLALVLAAGPVAARDVVVVYTAIENEQITDYMKAITKSLPGIDLKILRLSTGDISARFMAEKDNMQADVIWGVGATNMMIFKNAGLLEPYAPKGLERVQPLFRDRANPPAWVGIDIYMSAFCFNTEVAKKKNLPRPTSWADLTKPVYKGEVVMPNPASSGTGYLSVASILQRMKEAEGWKYLDALDKNIAEYTKSGSKPCKDAANGERAIGISFEYVALKMKKDGDPVDMVLPALKAARTESPEFHAKCKVLKDLVEHHIKEEEGQMFQAARQLFDEDQLRELGDLMQARKDTVQAMWENPLLRPVKKLQSAAHKMLPTKVKTAKATAIGKAIERAEER